ncbi:MAG TPA: hypothetical protein VK791_00275 [bacterium]|nr:hypothetical protein [bacterium]
MSEPAKKKTVKKAVKAPAVKKTAVKKPLKAKPKTTPIKKNTAKAVKEKPVTKSRVKKKTPTETPVRTSSDKKRTGTTKASAVVGDIHTGEKQKLEIPVIKSAVETPKVEQSRVETPVPTVPSAPANLALQAPYTPKPRFEGRPHFNNRP